MIFGSVNMDKLLSDGGYQPFPTADERKPWESLNDNIKKKLINEGERFKDYNWPQLLASSYLEYTRTGNQSNFNEKYFDRRYALGSLVVAECIEGKKRFLDDIINGIWLICEESSWVISAHNAEPADYNNPTAIELPDLSRKPLLCLFSLETSALLAWTSYLLKSELDAVTPIICERIYHEVKHRTLDTYLERDDYWWMGLRRDEGIVLNNWVPWTTSNLLFSYLFLEKDIMRIKRAFKKLMYSLDQFIKVYPQDGGCDEGPEYWAQAGASLHDCIEILQSCCMDINFFSEPIIHEIGKYIYKVNIDNDRFVNFADSSAKFHIPAEQVYRFGRNINDERMMSLGANALQTSDEKFAFSRWYPMYRVLNSLFNYDEILCYKVKPHYIRDAWFEGIQLMASRENEGTVKGLFLAAKGGNNNESHNHNDIGQFIVYLNGKPGIIDAGVGTYTSKTFSADRYSIWTMQSAHHNLPTINGIMQKDGAQYKASEVEYSCEDSLVVLKMDISGAYPETARINSWKRKFEMYRSTQSCIIITDDFDLAEEAHEVKLSLMVCKEPEADSEGNILLPVEGCTGLKLYYDKDKLDYSCETIKLTDPKLVEVWGMQIFRITLRNIKPVSKDKWIIKIGEIK